MGKKLKLIRIGKGFMQGYVAEYLGISRCSLCLKEADKHRFNAEEVIKLAILYEIDVKTLLDN